MENTLYYGDNLDILRMYIPDESIDLIYLDRLLRATKVITFYLKRRTGLIQ